MTGSRGAASAGGATLLNMLNILEHFDLKSSGAGSAQSLHIMAEAMKMAYADRYQVLGDSDFVSMPINGFISKAYGASRAKQIDPNKAQPVKLLGRGDPMKFESPSTTHFSVADAEGNIVDGDQIIAIIALAMRDAGTLINNTVVGTVMANLGFKLAMQREGINLIETAVGDRYVLEAMRDGGLNLGGEQSGHVILSEFATTGDGTLTALQLLARVAATGKSLAELAAVMTRLPQVLINVKGVDKTRIASSAALTNVVADVEAELAGNGRVLLRPSGTEPLVRVMVEAPTAEVAQSAAERIAAVVTAELSL